MILWNTISSVYRKIGFFLNIDFTMPYILHIVILLIIFGYCISALPNKTQNEINETWTYCNHPDCSLKNQHTLCLASKTQSPRLFVSGMTDWMRNQILLHHNRHRDNIALGLELGQPPGTNMRKMYWDYELELMAAVWARQCQKRHDECRNTIRFNVLQNMDVRPVVPRVTQAQLLSDAVASWFSGSRELHPENVWSFRLSNCSAASGGCNAHWYSAAAWGSTWRLGCSQSLCTAKKNSCSVYRKRRKIKSIIKQENYSNVTIITDNALLYRNAIDQSYPKPVNFGDIATADNMMKESPLHRGIIELAKEKKTEEINMIAYTFCNYGPAGNIDGFPIYEAGTACTNCPPGTRCGNNTLRALCAIISDPNI